MSRLLKAFLHFFVAFQSNVQKKPLYEIATEETNSVRSSLVFLVLPYFLFGGYSYLRDTGQLILLRNYETRVALVLFLLAMMYVIILFYIRKYLPKLAQDYSEAPQRGAPRWYTRLYVSIFTIEYIGLMVFSCIENHR